MKFIAPKKLQHIVNTHAPYLYVYTYKEKQHAFGS